MPTLFKRSNGIYYSIVTDPSGQRKWHSTGKRTKGAALESLRTRPTVVLVSIPRKNLSDFRDKFLEYARQLYTPGNLDVYRRSFGSFLNSIGDIPIASVNARSVDSFKVKRLGEHVSKTTINIELRTLRAGFNVAVRWELITANPFKGVSLLSLDECAPTFFRAEEFERFIGRLKHGWFRDVVVVAAMTGMRLGELLNLTWKAVDLKRRLITIESNQDFRTKRGKRRVVPINDTVMQVLGYRIAARDSEFVFTDGGERISREALSIRFKRKVRELELDDKLHFHSLRHSFASWLIQSGAPSVFEVQKLLGHTNIKTTEIYSHLLPENLLSTVNRIPVKPSL
jgi:integrase